MKRFMWLIVFGLALIAIIAVGAALIRRSLPGHSGLEQVAWYAQAVGVSVALPSILLLLMQLVDIKFAARTTAFEATASRIVRLTTICLDNVQAYDKLKGPAPYATSDSLLAEVMLDTMDTELLRRKMLPDQWLDDLPSLEPWFVDLFRELPGLCLTLDNRRVWYSTDLFELRVLA